MIASAMMLMSSSHNSCALAFSPNPRIATTVTGRYSGSSGPFVLRAAEEGSSKTSVVNQVTGEELEMMMQEWEQPLVIDAYATVSNVLLPTRDMFTLYDIPCRCDMICYPIFDNDCKVQASH